MTFDGASVNRRLVAIHDMSQKDLYKVVNIHSADRRFLYFFSDPPHLMKTTRNCWASTTRNLWVCHKNLLIIHCVDTGKWQDYFMAALKGPLCQRSGKRKWSFNGT